MKPNISPPDGRRLAYFLLLASVALVILLAVLGYRDTLAMVALTDARKQTRETLLTMERTLSLLKDAETGQRGFLLTGEEAYLEPYYAALAHFGDEYQKMSTMLATDPLQTERLRALDGHVARRFEILRNAIEQRRSAGLSAGVAAVKTGEGKATMDAIRALFAQIAADKRREIAQREVQVARVKARQFQLSLWLPASVLLLVGLSVTLLLREHRLRLRAETRARDAAASEARERQQLIDQRRIANILESITDSFVALDLDWRITYVNAQAASLAGRPIAELLGKNLWQEFPEINQMAEFKAACHAVMSTGQTVHREGYLPAWERWFENHLYRTEEGIAVYFRDITENKRAAEDLAASRDQLRAFAQAQNELMETERARIAREIHDQLGQIFTSLKLILGRLRTPLPDDAGTEVDEAARLLDEGVDVARRIAGELRPAVLDDFGLGVALKVYAERYARQTGLACAVEMQEDQTLDAQQAIQLYRIALEALTNVARHARARQVRIEGHVEESGYLLRIEDDGVGWPKEAPANSAGTSMGLTGMRERARLLGGSIQLGTTPGGGVFLQVRLPLAKQETESHEYPDRR